MSGRRLPAVLRSANVASGHAQKSFDDPVDRDSADPSEWNSALIDNSVGPDAADAPHDRAQTAAQTDADEEPHEFSESDPPAEPQLAPGRVGAQSLRLALIIGAAMTVAAASLAGWLGYQVHREHQDARTRALLVQGAKQGALNLTNIDFHHVDSDVQRILDGSIGAFHDEFQGRVAPFTDFIKSAKSVSRGEVAAAGLESVHRDEARVAVALNVTTFTGAQAESQQRAWRMRITVRDTGNETIKVSNVEFVP